MSDVSFLGLVAERLAAAPESSGVRCGDALTSWSEIDAWAWSVAARLRAEGIGRGDIVPVVTTRSAGLVAAWLGVLRAGAAYLPVDIDLPAGRVAFLGEDSAARTALVDAGGLVTARGLGADVTPIDVDRLRGIAAEPFDTALTGADAGCVLYTSGSTGRPKGVLVDHDALLHSALRWAWFDQLTPADSLLCSVSVAFDAATMVIGTALITAARLTLATDAQRRDPALLGPDLADVDLATMTPSALKAAVAGLAPGTATRLRSVSCGGELLTRELAAEFRDRLGCAVHNVWGVAEVPATTTTGLVDPEAPGEPGIGVPLPGTRVYVLDADLEPVPDGAPGELFIAGAGVGTGYLGRPALSAARFLPDPWADVPGARMYRTGDRGLRRPDGELVYLGRDDHQVKIRGNRVETGEIRTLLERCPGVRAAAVVLEGPDRLVGYLEAEPGTPPARADVLAELRRWLPAAVLPSALWLVEALPLNTNGKVDLRALRELPDAARRPLPGGDEPTGVREEGLERAAALFLEHLPEPPPRPGLAPDADFFMLGGASMGAARLVAAASRERGTELPLRDFLADPTPAGLARLLTASAGAARSVAVAAEGGPHPANPVQRRLWFLNQVPQLRTAYLVPCVLAVRGPGLDRGLLADALQHVLDRHPLLRARFTLDAEGGEVTYTTGRPGPVVTRVDLTAAGPEAARRVRERTEDLCRTPFDLGAEAPVRAEVIGTDDGAVVVLCAHHIAVDAQSLRVLTTELGAVYRARVQGSAPGLPVPPPHTHPAAADTPEAVRTATERLRGAPVDVLLPHDRPRGPVQDTAGATCPVPLDGVRPGLLRELARSEGVTPFMVATAVLAVALGRRSGQRDFLFATPWGGRDGAAADQVSMLVNTVVVRVDTRGAGSWRELLRRVRAASLAAFRDADVPFDALASALHPGRDLSRPPLTPVQVSVGEGEPAAPALGPGLSCSWLPSGHRHTKYELTLDLQDRPDGPLLALDYASALFDAATVRGVADDLRDCLTELERAADGPLWQGDAVAVTGTAPHPPLSLVTGPLPGPPEDTAVVHQGVRVPRGALDAWAWSIAARLRARGIGAGDVVPVVVSRGPLALAAWLGVLRAGAAYCPVAVDQPASRLAFLIEDTAARAAVVDGTGALALGACGAGVPLVPADGPGGEDARTEPVQVTADDLAYVLYTSGTTGRPKGVRVTHGNLAAYLSGLHAAHPELAARRTLLATPMDTDFAVTVLHGALATGGGVVIADQRQALDGAALARLLREHRVEVVKFTPSHLGALLRTPLRDAIAGLRAIVLGGEAVPASLAGELASLRDPDTLVLNHYGPTETTVGVLTHRIGPDEYGAPPVGRPLPGVTALILDEEHRPVPAGATGILWIGGPQVTAGYLNRPDTTREAFRTDPSGERRYRTGDLAFADADGRIHLRGRADDQIKVRGFRVEPGELRHALLGLPGVRQAEVLGHDGELAAFVVLDGTLTDRAAVRERLGALLPAQLVPDHLLALDRIPVARTGKADRAALRALLGADPAPRTVPEAGPAGAGGSLVEQVRQAWQDLLRVPEVPLDQAFFEAGGSSLLLIRLLERLRALTARPLEVGDLFRHATVRSQAALLRGPSTPPATVPAQATPGGGGGDRSRLAARRRRTTPQRTSNRKASE